MKTYFRFCPRCATKLVFKKEHREETRVQTCPKCGFAFYNNPVGATECVIVRNGKVLLLKRNRNPRKGFFDFPGGYLEGFETPIAGAIRETREETGMRFKPSTLIGTYANTQYYWKGRTIPTIVLSYLGTASGTLKVSPEVSTPTWSPLAKKVTMAFRYQNQVLRDVRQLLKP